MMRTLSTQQQQLRLAVVDRHVVRVLLKRQTFSAAHGGSAKQGDLGIVEEWMADGTQMIVKMDKALSGKIRLKHHQVDSFFDSVGQESEPVAKRARTENLHQLI